MIDASLRMRMMKVRSAVRLHGKKSVRPYSDEWYTPDAIPAALGRFDLDPCAGPKMHALRNWKSCGLSRKWTGRVWLNPPYSNVHEWLAKMVRHGRGTLLVNARPETKWFQDAVRQADAVLWLRGRVNFERPDGGPTHNAVGSVLVAFGTADAAALMRCNLPGLRMVISAFEGVPS